MDPPHAALRAPRVEPADHWAPARDVVGLPRARLGRLLGMGSSGERGAHAVARHHRVPALRAGPGEARAHARVEFRPGHPRVPARRVRHVHRAQWSRALSAHVCDQRHRPMVSGLSRGLHRFLSGAAGVPRRRVRVGDASPRDAGLARGCFRPPEPVADRGGCCGPVGHGPPADLRLVRQRASRQHVLLRASGRASPGGNPGVDGRGATSPVAPGWEADAARAALAGRRRRDRGDWTGGRRRALASGADRRSACRRRRDDHADRIRQGAAQETRDPGPQAASLRRVPGPSRAPRGRGRHRRVAARPAGEGRHARARSGGDGRRLHAHVHRF